MIGFNPNGAIISWEIKDLKNYPVSYKATTFMEALYEMFDLSRGEIRRLINGGSLRGWYAEKIKPADILKDDEQFDDRWDFVAIQLGKRNIGGVGIPRHGFIVLNKDIRRALEIKDDL